MQATSRAAKAIQTTKWGTACAQCASAKAKCSRKATDRPGTKCDRCERLLKQCTDQVHRPRKPRQPKQQQRFGDSTGYDSLTASPMMTSSEGRSPSASPSMSMTGSISHPPSPEQWLLNTGTSPASLDTSPSESKSRHLSVPGLYSLYTGQQQDSDEKLVDIFRNELMPRFPFVIVHPDVTADALNVNRPFLMSAIRLVASLRNPESMRGQVGQIMSHIADNILVRGQRSLDLLLGMLVVIGWYHYYQLQNCQLNSFLCLTESLIANLGLGQNTRSRDGSEVQPSSEEQRALLGAWYLRSCVATQFNQLKPMQFTAHMHQCLGEINRDREYESDELLVLLVRIQHLTSSISPGSPEHVLTATWRGLDSIVQNAPHARSKDPLATLALNAAALRLQKHGSVRYNHTPNSIKSWLDSWLARLPTSMPYPLPTASVFHLIYTIAVLEEDSSTPSRPDFWENNFWTSLEEKTLLPRGLVMEWARMDCSSENMDPRGQQYPEININCPPTTSDIRLGGLTAVSLPPNLSTVPSMALPQQQQQILYQQPTNTYNPQVDEQLQWMSWNPDLMVGTEGSETSIDPQLWFDAANFGQQPQPQQRQPHQFNFHHQQ